MTHAENQFSTGAYVVSCLCQKYNNNNIDVILYTCVYYFIFLKSTVERLLDTKIFRLNNGIWSCNCTFFLCYEIWELSYHW